MRTRHESPQFRGTHLPDILEDHMIAHRIDYQINFVARKTKARHYFLGHLCPHSVVPIESNPLIDRIKHSSRRLADIVQKYGENLRLASVWLQRAQHQSGMDKHVPFRMELFRLVASLECFNLRKDHSKETALIEEIESAETLRVD